MHNLWFVTYLFFIIFYFFTGLFTDLEKLIFISILQQLTLQHPAVRSKLGLPLKDAPVGTNNPGKAPLDTPTKWKRISVEKLSPKELLAVNYAELNFLFI